MRNDQIAVLLRDFANRCLQWAAVLEHEDDKPFPDVPVQLPDAPKTDVAQTTSPSASGNSFSSTTDDSRQIEREDSKTSLPTSASSSHGSFRSVDYDDVMTPSEIRNAVTQAVRLPKHEYACLVAYATAFKENALHWYVGRDGVRRVYLSKYAVWTDAEIEEALR